MVASQEHARMQRSDEQWLLMAYQAATKSPDPSTQNGAVIPAHNNVVLQACNEFPVGVKYAEGRLERPLKYSFIEHAERNVVYQAAKLGVSLHGLTMYACWFACADCARAIIQSGITKVVGHKQMMDGTPDHWKESIKVAFDMFQEAGVQTELLDVYLNGPRVLFNGKHWQP
jgi:dCMP deaminase